MLKVSSRFDFGITRFRRCLRAIFLKQNTNPTPITEVKKANTTAITLPNICLGKE